jgi:hypothetical protein
MQRAAEIRKGHDSFDGSNPVSGWLSSPDLDGTQLQKFEKIFVKQYPAHYCMSFRIVG